MIFKAEPVWVSVSEVLLGTTTLKVLSGLSHKSSFIYALCPVWIGEGLCFVSPRSPLQTDEVGINSVLAGYRGTGMKGVEGCCPGNQLLWPGSNACLLLYKMSDES